MFDLKVDVNLKVPGLKAHLKEVAEKAIERVAKEEIEPRAKDLSPKDTGHNAKTITTEIAEVSGSQKVEVQMFTTSGYGGYLEAGTRKMAARPYLWTAYQENKQRFFKRIKELWGK